MALTIALAYGGHDEITDAVRALLREAAVEGKALADAAEAVTPAAIARHLYMAGLPDFDLIIRTSGESRLSGFLLWQSAYSELYFTDVNWPAFRKIDFLRRQGGTTEVVLRPLVFNRRTTSLVHRDQWDNTTHALANLKTRRR